MPCPAHHQTLERDQAYCAAFSEVLGSGKFLIFIGVLGFKSLAPQLPVGTDIGAIRKVSTYLLSFYATVWRDVAVAADDSRKTEQISIITPAEDVWG
ncbi:MAG TPA: hypothetical protein DEB50_13970 [Desulfobacter sp.]|nr:hypothetical protein [Desulfobacter sp.]